MRSRAKAFTAVTDVNGVAHFAILGRTLGTDTVQATVSGLAITSS